MDWNQNSDYSMPMKIHLKNRNIFFWKFRGRGVIEIWNMTRETDRPWRAQCPWWWEGKFRAFWTRSTQRRRRAAAICPGGSPRGTECGQWGKRWGKRWPGTAQTPWPHPHTCGDKQIKKFNRKFFSKFAKNFQMFYGERGGGLLAFFGQLKIRQNRMKKHFFFFFAKLLCNLAMQKILDFCY